MPIGRRAYRFQIVEEGRFVACLYALEDGEVHLERFLHRVEDAPHRVRRRVAGNFLHLAVGEQVDVEFRPDTFQRAREAERRHVRSFRSPERVEYGAQNRRIVARAVWEAFGENYRNDIGIHHNRADCILE